jgi:hypothetical protein
LGGSGSEWTQTEAKTSKGKEKEEDQEVQSWPTSRLKIGSASRRQEPDEKLAEEAQRSSANPETTEPGKNKAPTVEELHQKASEQAGHPPFDPFTTRLGRPVYMARDVKPIAFLDTEEIDRTCKEVRKNFLKKVEEKKTE